MRLHIQYKDNQPVPIFTQNVKVPEGEQPTIADLKAAFFPNTPPNELGQFSLHYEEGGEALRPGLALSKLIRGQSDLEPLIIKSRNEEQGSMVDNPFKKQKLDSVSLQFASKVPTMGNFFDVEGLDVAGLENGKLISKRLYCRQDTVNLLSALNKFAPKEQKGLRIVGPPGVGKSVTTWYWACYQASVHGKTVLWIHCSLNKKLVILSVKRDGVEKVTVPVPKTADFIDNDLSDYVVIDGITRSESHNMLVCSVFSYDSNPHRFAVSVASVATKENPADDNASLIKRFKSEPWNPKISKDNQTLVIKTIRYFFNPFAFF